MPFYENYVKLCNSIGKTPSGAAIEIGLTKPSVNRWKKGGGVTDATAQKIADYFDVPVFALVDEDPDNFHRINRIYQTLLKRGKTLKWLSEKTGFPEKEIRDFGFLERTEGMRDCLEAVANALDVEPAYLLGAVPQEQNPGVYWDRSFTKEEWESLKYDPYVAYGFIEDQELEDQIKHTEDEERAQKEKAPATKGKRLINDDDLKVAYFRGADADLTKEDMDALWEDAKNFRDFIIEKRKKERNGG